ncbi:Chitinase 1 [Datura stramonium]|uniref:chitinase n=1 Tax=Datura stramonium TaxID=4076 RepID=A0ABS8UQD0_DATST|nr:Chitinase 1 [Datura stramonium]
MSQLCVFATLSMLLVPNVLAEQCGKQADDALCPSGYCCSNFGWCGTTGDYCDPDKCQSQCPPPPPPPCPPPPFTPPPPAPSPDITEIIGSELFKKMLSYGTRIGVLLGASTPTMPLSKRQGISLVLPPLVTLVTVKGSNYNYGPCGVAIGEDLLGNPDLVENDVLISFKAALWFWMTPQPPKPSCHDVIIGKWVPSPTDQKANRFPGYGVITNIINGGLECGHGPDDRVKNRIGFYLRYCPILGVSPGENLDCGDQRPFPPALLFNSM